MNIYDILAKIRQQSITERQKGAVFEKLMQRWLKSDPRYCHILKDVWMWEEFPAKAEFGGKDTGIDLVARTEEGEYWAIQCKCYDENAIIDKPAVDSFLSTSSKTFTDDVTLKTVGFSLRLWISTTDHWGPTANETIKNQNPPVQRIGLEDLNMSPVDWAKLEGGSQGDNVRLAGKQLMEHQLKAISKARTHFIEEGNDRGKLVMACGTGKTYTALNLVEQLTDSKGLILFMVPSIALLGQALNDWSADSKKPFKAVCICSDSKSSKITKKNNNFDDKEESITDLPLPATTNADTIAKQLKLYRKHSEQGKGMVVVFSTYQSVDAVSEAQKAILKETNGEYGVFDYIVCDEAHRTTGVMKDRDNESSFTKIHDDKNVQGKKRLYMTATPRLYGESAQKKAAEKDAVLFSMDDEDIYGKEFFRVNFSYAVEHGLLTDYKVLVLTVNGSDLPANIKEKVENPSSKEFDFDDTTKLIGVINGLAKQVKGDGGKTWEVDPRKMHRALAFCSSIGDDYKPGTSKNVAHVLPQLSQDYYNSLNDGEKDKAVLVEAKHIDGSMDSMQRNEKLQWLREEPENDNVCKVITNVRCLSEGVDVPALDAVLFLSARNSQVDVVQSVGRIMRNFKKGTPEEKKYGYIIIPIVVDENQKPEEVLNNSTTFEVVWSILNALRSHDDNFNAEVNKINLNKKKNDPTDDPSRKITIGGVALGGDDDKQDVDDAVVLGADEVGKQLTLRFGELKEGIYAKLVEKCGDRLYWENWAKEVGEVAKNFIARITQMVLKEGVHKEEFENFLEGLKKNINDSIDGPQAVEMLAQHLITRPVFDALFAEYEFVKNNAVSRSMQHMIELLEDKGLTKDLDVLEKFYDSVKRNVTNIDNLEGKQSIIKSLYEKFFKGAFPLTVEKLGIVYTPVECVDFIIRSVNDILKQEFDTSLTEENVHILDPFTGTGTFITRLMQSGLIKKEDLERKYLNEIHCNEIVLLAYYIADVNIESVFHDIVKRDQYLPYDGICLTDTFQLNETGDNDIFSQLFPENSERLKKQKKAPVRVVIGNPPYSVGQKEANDNAQNLSYKNLEKRISETYADSKATNLKSLYDSYIKAFRWASDRINANGNKDGGIVAFISNGAWLDGNAQDGMRKCFEDEFSSIYVLNLRGNCRTSGEMRRKEGDGVFGLGSRTPIAITFLVKNPKAENKKAVIHYHDIGDYLSREDKLKKVKEFRSLGSGKIDWQIIKPNDKHDWINQRDGVFDILIPLSPKNSSGKSLFDSVAIGVATNRDAWDYNYSKESLSENIKRCIDYYNQQKDLYAESVKTNPQLPIESFIKDEPTYITWTRALRRNASNGEIIMFDENAIKTAYYRPFMRVNLYYGDRMVESRGQWDKYFPKEGYENLCICVSGVGVTKPFSCIITNIMPDLELIGKSQCFSINWYEERGEKKAGNQLELFEQEEGEGKYIRHDGVSDWILKEVRTRYGNLTSITKEDIFYYVYGILHSEEYRTRFADDLRKSLPRIPIVEKVADFVAFNKAGRALADLHLNYESVAAHPEVKVTELGKKEDYIDEETGETVLNGDAYKYYAVVEKMRFPTGQKAKDKPGTIIYNPHITIENIPAEAYDYVVNGKSAIEWIMERYAVTTDKDSQIKNDCNDWSKEHNQPRYILDLLLSIINVSVQTMAIVKSLPSLNLGATQATTTTPQPAEIKPIVEEVEAAEQYVRYLPVFNLKAACGAFEDNELPSVKGWVNIESSSVHPKGDNTYFVCQAKGQSMQPKIEDGDMVICRFYTPQSAGSRNGKMVIAQTSEYDGDYDGKYTIKEYRSEKNADGSRKAITLHPLNKDYSPIELTEDDDVRIVAEVVGVVKR